MGLSEISRLLSIMARLRDPDSGCPWDVKQDFRSIAPFTIEEAYEVADAIDRDDFDDLRDELGDLLFQVVYHARMAEESGAFNFDDVTQAICSKLVRRHPHVFGEGVVADAEAQTVEWERHKAREREEKGVSHESALDGITRGMPALARALKLGSRASTTGFDWPDVSGVVDKLREEVTELEEVLGKDLNREEEEIGDLLFSIANLCRHRGIDPETALRRGNSKFESRFRELESRLRTMGKSADETSIEELEHIWQSVKRDL
ncbi:MAG: nucleoside triphosphate pyrophosphohydrolase [Gammaproteobacteria bacterium]